LNPRIQRLIAAGESREVEFKTAHSALNRDLYQTVCAFLNRDGGDILLGVKDDGSVQGVDPDRIQQMKEDFATAVNNPQKLNPPCYLSLQAVDYDGVTLLHLAVPPHHKTDAILRRVNTDRYDDRDDIRTNLLESYDHLIAFGEKHLNDPFYQDGLQRISLRSHILREIMGNLLIHREYSNAFPAKFVIEADRVFTENANRPHGHGPIDPRLFSPFPKNPVIARVFKEVGLADELGSGTRRLFKYCKLYSGHDPELVEADVFRFNLTVSPADDPRPEKAATQTESGSDPGLVEGLVESQRKIITLVQADPRISKREMATRIGISSTAVDKNITALKKLGLLRRTGADKGGHWQVLT
jgi:ATP-dependent DNA helicase RecG